MKLFQVSSVVVALSLFFSQPNSLLAQTVAGQRLPGNANALMTVDVAKVLQSPLAKTLGWQSKMIKGYADRPLAVPATAKKVTIAALVHPAGMRTIWEAAVIELLNAPNFDPILRAQGGYLDQIGGKRAAWTPQDVFYVDLGQNTLGIVRPGQRQYVTKWVTGAGQTGFSPFLKAAQTAAGDADVLFAVDLDDVVGLTSLRYSVRMGQLPSLAKFDEASNPLMTALASVKGLRLTMRFGEKIDGEMVIEFDQPITALGDAAKPFVTDVLTCADLYEPALDSWQYKADGKNIICKGTMEPEALNRLLTLLSPAGIPNATDSVATTTTSTPAKTEPADPKLDAAAASQQYYQAISKVLSGINSKASPTDSGRWLVAKGRTIEQLPLLNVDPALVEWGNMVVEGLNRAATELGVGQSKAQVAAQGVASPTAYTSYNEYGDATNNDTAESRAAFRNAEQQRRAAAQGERTAAAERALAILNQVLATRGKIRSDMVQKYGVEF